jgi:Tfp pilus assembly protein PilV
MRSLSSNKSIEGMTLIEVILYVVLLCLLLTTIIQYEYDIHAQNIDLIYQIQDATASSTQ